MNEQRNTHMDALLIQMDMETSKFEIFLSSQHSGPHISVEKSTIYKHDQMVIYQKQQTSQLLFNSNFQTIISAQYP